MIDLRSWIWTVSPTFYDSGFVASVLWVLTLGREEQSNPVAFDHAWNLFIQKFHLYGWDAEELQTLTGTAKIHLYFGDFCEQTKFSEEHPYTPDDTVLPFSWLQFLQFASIFRPLYSTSAHMPILFSRISPFLLKSTEALAVNQVVLSEIIRTGGPKVMKISPSLWNK